MRDEDIWLRKNRLLTHALLISGALNIGLIASLVLYNLRTPNRQPIPEKSEMRTFTNGEILSRLFQESFDQLIQDLSDVSPAEDGYKVRDLALAVLVSYHNFNLERALPSYSCQKREMALKHHEGESITLTVFPGLTDDQYRSLKLFAQTEKWPLTAEGLFYELKALSEEIPHSLKEAFYLTPEFHAIYTLFSRTNFLIEREMLLSLILEGDWETFARETQRQVLSGSFTDEHRQYFLRAYLSKKSLHAAHLLFEMDRAMMFRKGSDEELSIMLDLLESPSQEFLAFLEDMKSSLRSDPVRKKAAELLSQLTGKEVPMLKPLPRIHRVTQGDTLWKIARHYGVKLDELKALNEIKSEYALRPGVELRIP